ARDQLAGAGGGLPVELAQAVADAVLAHLVEVGAFATAALHMCTDQSRGLVGTEQRKSGEWHEVGIDPHLQRRWQRALLPPQPPWRADAQLHAFEGKAAALLRLHVVMQRTGMARPQLHALRQ